MINTIINEELVSFKELEKKIYSYVCEFAREITKQIIFGKRSIGVNKKTENIILEKQVLLVPCFCYPFITYKL